MCRNHCDFQIAPSNDKGPRGHLLNAMMQKETEPEAGKYPCFTQAKIFQPLDAGPITESVIVQGASVWR